MTDPAQTMSNNLVDRLRGYVELTWTGRFRNDAHRDIHEAADEIEKLRHELWSAREQIRTLNDTLDKQDREHRGMQTGKSMVGTLQRENHDLQKELATHLAVHLGVVRENARLREELRSYKQDALRYRYLRIHRFKSWELFPAEVLDKAVDTAIKQAKP